MEIQYRDFTTGVDMEKRTAFAHAFRYLCEQNPLPPLPYPGNHKKLKRLKALMKTQKNRERWQRDIAATRVRVSVQNAGSWTPTGALELKAVEMHETRLVLDFIDHKHLALECKLPLDEVLAVKALIWS